MNKAVAYADVLDRLVAESIACCPDTWAQGRLCIEADEIRILCRIDGHGAPGTASISEALRDLVDELYVRMDRHGDTWVEAVIEFRRDGDCEGRRTWFRYSRSAKVAADARRPWWKRVVGGD